MPTIQSNGVTVNYHDVGSGPAIVLIHCSSSSHRQWRDFWELMEQDYRIIAVDALGWGGTDAWDNKGNALLDDEAALIHAITEDIVEEFHLVGHSYGGTIAYHTAMKSPERIKSLTLIEPMLGWFLDPVDDQEYYDEIRGVAQFFWDSVKDGDPEKGIQHYFDYWNGPDSWVKLDEKLADYVLAGAAKNVHEFQVIFEGGTDLEPPETFNNPVLLLGGEQSRKPPLKALSNLGERLPNERRKFIEGAGHMSPITHSDQVNSIIKNFIES